MAWEPPTVNDLKSRYPEFKSVDEDLAGAVLTEAIGEVGPSWIEKDRTPAVLSLAAHLLATQGYGVSGASGPVSTAITGAIKRFKVGDVETEFAGSGGGAAAGGAKPLDKYRTTAYGLRFLEIMRRNFPAVLSVT